MSKSNLQTFGTTVSIKSNIRFGQLHYLNDDLPTGQSASPAPAVSLSRRQEEVLRLLIQGYSNKQIALALNMAQGTVKVHVTAVLHKLGVTGRTAAAVAGAKLLAGRPAGKASGKPAEIERSHPFGPSRIGVAA